MIKDKEQREEDASLYGEGKLYTLFFLKKFLVALGVLLFFLFSFFLLFLESFLIRAGFFNVRLFSHRIYLFF